MRDRFPLVSFLCLLVLVWPRAGPAQVVSGADTHPVVVRVVDVLTGDPLAGVVIRNPASGLQASTGSRGELSLRTQGSGTLALEFAKAGYRTALRLMLVDRPRQILVELAPDPDDAPAGRASVEGAVIDAATGTPVEGAAVIGALSDLAASTGPDGTFSLPGVPPGRHHLVFSRLGYAEREFDVDIEAGRRVDVRVELASAPIELDSVSVTAERRGPVPESETQSLGAATVISEFGAAQNVAEVLQWQVPGLQVSWSPTGEASLQIRGTASLMNQGQPLIVLDGMPVDSGMVSWALRRLHPGQIERIRVLRDVASTSVYGIRGAHGVILIDLKRR